MGGAHARILPAMRGIVFCAAVVAAAGAWAASSPDSGPRIDVDETNYSFGRVPDDRAVEHVFRVKNAGNKPLVVSRVRSSCGCAAAMMESSVIQPGETGKLRVSFNPTRQKGTVTRSISVYSNDTDNPTVNISISAQIVPAGQEGQEREPEPRAHERKGELVFDSGCLRCHGPGGKGQAGRDLYVSVCAHCHGADGKGRKIDEETIGPSLETARRSVKSKGGLNQIICDGSGDPSMPGFCEKYGGPLSKKQVASLAELIFEGVPAE